MQRITISLDDDTARALDAHVAQRGYGNRSEAVRDLVREAASRHEAGAHGKSCIGVLSYLFDHERRDLARKLVHTHHDHHALNLSTLHLHLDARRCLEVAVLQGSAAQLRELADQGRLAAATSTTRATSTTGLTSLPIPSISHLTTSPCLRNCGSLMA
jgi:CopG family transcriptional regulator, nickel-responsive regulator